MCIQASTYLCKPQRPVCLRWQFNEHHWECCGLIWHRGNAGKLHCQVKSSLQGPLSQLHWYGMFDMLADSRLLLTRTVFLYQVLL